MNTLLDCVRRGTQDVPVQAVAFSERMYEPTEKQIEAMMASLKRIGQLTPIMVHPVTSKSYRVVAGGTRLRAAMKLGWPKIRAEIIAGPSIDYRIIELTENLERRDLTAKQRKEVKAKLKELLKEKAASAEVCKGGRGNKGGVSEVARQMGVSRRTVARTSEETKPGQNIVPAQVSNPKSADSVPRRNPTGIRFTDDEMIGLQRFNKLYCDNGPLSACVRIVVRKGLGLALEKEKAA